MRLFIVDPSIAHLYPKYSFNSASVLDPAIGRYSFLTKVINDVINSFILCLPVIIDELKESCGRRQKYCKGSL